MSGGNQSRGRETKNSDDQANRRTGAERFHVTKPCLCTASFVDKGRASGVDEPDDKTRAVRAHVALSRRVSSILLQLLERLP